jgi:hypothetical protein
MPAKVLPPLARRKIVRQRRRTLASRPAIDLVLAPKVNVAEPIWGPLVPDLDMARAPPSTLNLQPSTPPNWSGQNPTAAGESRQPGSHRN